MTDSSAALHKLKPGDVFQKRYQILERVGDGGFGAVYKSRHVELGLTVALKILHAQLLVDEESRSRFQREGRILEALSHPNVVRRLYEYGFSTEQVPFIAMEYLQGNSLRSELNKCGSLPFDKVIDIGIQVCAALAAAHECGVVHRDLKPNNILLPANAYGSVKLLDFGLSRLTETSKVSLRQSITKERLLIGCAQYMSPEQATGGEADHRSDIYALGCILYEALCRMPALFADNPIGLLHKHANETPQPLTEALNQQLPPGLDVVLENAMAKDPEIRYQSAMQMRHDLMLVKQLRGQRVLKRSASYKPTAVDWERSVKKSAIARKLTIIAAVSLLWLWVMAQFYPGLK